MRVLVSIPVLGAFAAFLPLLVTAVLYAVRAKSAARLTVADPPVVSRHVPELASVARGDSLFNTGACQR